MAQNMINAQATVNASVKENIEMMTKDQIRTELEKVGVEMSNTAFKKTKKAELVAMLEQHTFKVEIIDVGDLDITKDTVVVEEKMDKKQDAMLGKWDKLVKAVATEYVAQSLGKKWALFYKNTKSSLSDAYLVKTRKLCGATAKVIRSIYGEQNTTEDNIKQLLNVMVIRGYLNFKKVNGEKGENIIFSATTNQMNAMWKLSKQ